MKKKKDVQKEKWIRQIKAKLKINKKDKYKRQKIDIKDK